MAKIVKNTPSYQVKPNDGGPLKYPNPNDVLSGRGGRINNHPGNIYFRELITAEKVKYLSLQKKMDKALIALDIVDQIRKLEPPGRFLKQNSDTLYWHEIGDERARKKAGQALREDGPGLRKEIDQEEDINISTCNSYRDHNEFPRNPMIDNGIYSAPPYPNAPYMRRPVFHHQMNSSQFHREYIAHAPTASISNNNNQSNLITSRPPFDKPSQFAQIRLSQYPREFIRPGIPSIPTINYTNKNLIRPFSPIQNKPQNQIAMKKNDEIPVNTAQTKKASISTTIDYEPIPIKNQKRRRFSKLKNDRMHQPREDNSISTHSEEQCEGFKIDIDELENSFSTNDEEQSTSLEVDIDDLILETFSAE